MIRKTRSSATGGQSDMTVLCPPLSATHEDKDEEAIVAMEAKLCRCLTSDKRDQAKMAVEQAQQIAEQFIEDFGRLEGT
jgi:hypothetical protein